MVRIVHRLDKIEQILSDNRREDGGAVQAKPKDRTDGEEPLTRRRKVEYKQGETVLFHPVSHRYECVHLHIKQVPYLSYNKLRELACLDYLICGGICCDGTPTNNTSKIYAGSD